MTHAARRRTRGTRWWMVTGGVGKGADGPRYTPALHERRGEPWLGGTCARGMEKRGAHQPPFCLDGGRPGCRHRHSRPEPRHKRRPPAAGLLPPPPLPPPPVRATRRHCVASLTCRPARIVSQRRDAGGGREGGGRGRHTPILLRRGGRALPPAAGGSPRRVEGRLGSGKRRARTSCGSPTPARRGGRPCQGAGAQAQRGGREMRKGAGEGEGRTPP